jgi:hypothetical protein
MRLQGFRSGNPVRSEKCQQALCAGGKQIPSARQALQVMGAPLGKFQAGAGDKVGHNPRNKNLAGLGFRHDAGCGVHRDAADIPAPDFLSRGMEACAQRQANLL